jgi:hypothetical protein
MTRSLRIATLLAAFMLAAPAFTPAHAQEIDYATVKGWRIFSGPAAVAGGDMCYASKDNGSVELRIATEGTGEWLIGMPYYEDGEVQGQFGFGDTGGYLEQATFSASNGWAYMVLPAPEALKDSDTINLELDRGTQSFDLSGSAAAMTKVEECVANGGKAPRNKKAMMPEIDEEEVATKSAPVEDDAYRFGAGCPKMGAVVSENTGRKAKAVFRYKIASGRAAMIYWLDFDGKPVEMSTFDETENVVRLNTFIGHSFIVKDFDGTCYGGFFEVQPGKNVFVVR